MRLPERIPIFIKLVDFDKLEKHWDTDISQKLRSSINLQSETIKYWEDNFDQRFGQMLINQGLISDSFHIWNDEYDEILKSQGVAEREFMFWGKNYDKDMNKLPETQYVLIKDMDTDHIKNILDGGWVKFNKKYYEIFLNELKHRNEIN